MPTISEPQSSRVVPIRGTALASEMAEAIRLDLADRGIRPTRLNVIAMALDVGVAEHVAVQLAELIEQTDEIRHAA